MALKICSLKYLSSVDALLDKVADRGHYENFIRR